MTERDNKQVSAEMTFEKLKQCELIYKIAYDRGFKDGDRFTAQSIAKARKESLEKAERVALFNEDYGCNCAEKIRNLKSEGKR